MNLNLERLTQCLFKIEWMSVNWKSAFLSCSRGWFRSTDLWVMGPARFLCATLLKGILLVFTFSLILRGWYYQWLFVISNEVEKNLTCLSNLCSRLYHRGISSLGRALALHARGTGIDTRILHLLISFRIGKRDSYCNKTLDFPNIFTTYIYPR